MLSNTECTVQKIVKKLESELELAEVYYSIILSINNIHITKRKRQLLAFIACKGLSSVTNRQEFCSKYSSSQATINNMASELIEERLLYKENKKLKVNKSLALDFNKNIVLNISLSNAHG